jgi:hypothetical protein
VCAGAGAIEVSRIVSYAHADTRWAERLHGRLEGFRIDKDLVGCFVSASGGNRCTLTCSREARLARLAHCCSLA